MYGLFQEKSFHRRHRSRVLTAALGRHYLRRLFVVKMYLYNKTILAGLASLLPQPFKVIITFAQHGCAFVQQKSKTDSTDISTSYLAVHSSLMCYIQRHKWLEVSGQKKKYYVKNQSSQTIRENTVYNEELLKTKKENCNQKRQLHNLEKQQL